MSPGGDKPEPLPRLRLDLRLYDAAPGPSGEPRWTIYDPLQHKFVNIDGVAHKLLSLWPRCKTVSDLAEQAWEVHQLHVDVDDVRQFGRFLAENYLTADAGNQGWKALHHRSAGQKHSLVMTLIHNYLFFRIPLVRPGRFLRTTYPFIAPLFTQTAAAIFGLTALIGLYLASRQWDAFLSTFKYFYTYEGMLALGATMIGVKLIHELGHAYMAVRLGCEVPTMGVAFMVLAPIPYTDVTDAWKLKDRRQRLMIDAAGMMAEMMVAAVATFLWAFLADGPVRSLSATLATVGWVMSLAINLNPLMRFDGYFIMSDWLGIENLQSRAFAVGRWKLREVLFRLGRPCPEPLPRSMMIKLTAYAWVIWVYRLVLYLGIAVLVYHHFFKVLGIILFMVEIVYFLAKPAWSEIAAWFKDRKAIIASTHARLTMAAGALAFLILILPTSLVVRVPAVLELAQTTQVFPPRAAYIRRVLVSQGDMVSSGQVVAELQSPDLDNEISLSETNLKIIQLRLDRRAGDNTDLQATLELESQKQSLVTKIAELRKQQQDLIIRAPIAGQVLELDSDAHNGRWINPREMIALIGNPERVSARGYLGEADLWRITDSRSATFFPEMPTGRAVPLRILDIARAGALSIEIGELSSEYGGAILVEPDANRRQVPATAQYMMHFAEVSPGYAPKAIERGTIHIQAKSESPVARLWRQALQILVRESGA